MYRVPARFVTRCAGVGGNELYSNELRNGTFTHPCIHLSHIVQFSLLCKCSGDMPYTAEPGIFPTTLAGG